MIVINHGGPVSDINISKKTTISGIFDEMAESGGFESVNMAEGLDILESMMSDEKCVKFVSFVGALVSTGLRGIIKDMMRRKLFDVAITTCGALDHDIARSASKYLKGSFTMDDAKLLDEDIHRLGSVLVPKDVYGPAIENMMQPWLEEAYKQGTKRMNTAELCKMIGSHLGEDSFLYWAYKNDIPVAVPGIMDGAVGSQVWMFSQKHPDFILDVTGDGQMLSGKVFGAKSTGALMIGGGISKHHTLWWNQYRGGLDYALYVTTASEFDGSLSGAKVREAISWGKGYKNCKTGDNHSRGHSGASFPICSATLKNLRLVV